MAVKTRKLEEVLSLSVETPKVVAYADYFMKNPLFTVLQIKNAGATSLGELTLTVSNENGLVTSYSKFIEEIPFESKVAVDFPKVLSPLYFVNLEEPKEEELVIELYKEKKLIVKETVTLTALPFDYWEGTSGNAERLAGFVRPKLADCGKIRTDVASQLKK